MRIKRSVTRALAVTALAASTTMAIPASAHAATAASTVPYLCPVEYEGQTYVLNYSRDFEVMAPDTVRPYQIFPITFDPEPINPRTEFNTKAWDVKMVYNLPAGTQVVGYKLVGGSNLGDSQQRVEFSPGRVTLHASGPFTAGEDHDLPDLKVYLRAPGSGVLNTSVGGTSQSDPGFRWTAEDPTTFEVGVLPCYPDPAKPVVLSTTKVGWTR
ncbi:hypothetical protein I3F58_12040 [Streptomyces sp. MUM 203J]|uniref:hypothetical protein n=1 Tax=Streptomyces sp. MUM 203J TaxID=2791990 RepID=UPI001F03DD5A|nr:hypothetical protein [Streptomyces sp. MUM 203J]MCH0540287.1 hypothetical protein [Streptomyces sp. MUM 203J]